MIVGAKYLQASIDLVYEVSFKLGNTLWRAVLKGIALSDKYMNGRIYELLRDERWSLAETLAEFAVQQKNISSEQMRRSILINYVQSIKWGGDPKRALSILEREDWTASTLVLQLARAVLSDDYAVAAALMRRIGKSDDISQRSYLEWPLFREFRTHSDFTTAFRDIFGEDFEVVAARTLHESAKAAQEREKENVIEMPPFK